MSGALEQLDNGFAPRTKFTPGPLHTKRSAIGDWAVVDENGSVVAEAFIRIGTHADEARANAQLFATAPSLYTATHKLAFLLNSSSLIMRDTLARRMIQDAVAEALAAIAAVERGAS